MKRKWLLGIAIALCAVVVGGGAFALANWIVQTKNENNTVTVGNPTTTSLTGTLNRENLLPGEEVSQDYTVSIENPDAKMSYNLEILDIVDGTKTAEVSYFEISVLKKTEESASGSFSELAPNTNLLSGLADQDVVTVTIRLKSDAPASIAGATLTFSLQLNAVPIQA